MNLLAELAVHAATPFSTSIASVSAFRDAYASAWHGIGLVLSDERFAGLRLRLGVRSDEHRQQLLDELDRLEEAGFEVGGRAGEDVADLLERAGYRFLAETLRDEHPLLHQFAIARFFESAEHRPELLGNVRLRMPGADPTLAPVLAVLRQHAVRAEEVPIAEESDEDYEDEEEAAPRKTVTPGSPALPVPPPAPEASVPVPARVPVQTPVRRPTHLPQESRRPRPKMVGTKDEAPVYRRRASVRWYRRMNPQRMFPLTITLAQARLREPTKPGVGQAVAREQLVVTKDEPYIRVRPVLPGCTCYPDEQLVDATPAQVDVRFQIVPQVLGTIEDARVEFYQGHRLITQVDLPIVVNKQTMAIVFASLGLAWPVLGTVVQTVGVGSGDTQALLVGGLRWALSLPHALEIGLGLGILAATAWWWCNRPRESDRNVGLNDLAPMTVPELLEAARTALSRGDRVEARSCVEDALNLDPLNSIAADLLRRCQ